MLTDCSPWEDYMASGFETEELKDKLIIAGINELETHGSEDFSLRRVAYACGVSCAAPYKHFKNKEGLIIEILKFYYRQWKLLEEQIIQVHGSDIRRLILELSMANIRFRLANPNYRFLFTLNNEAFADAKHEEIANMNGRISEYIQKLCSKEECSKDKTDAMVMNVNAIIFGSAMLLEAESEENIEKGLEIVRKRLKQEI